MIRSADNAYRHRRVALVTARCLAAACTLVAIVPMVSMLGEGLVRGVLGLWTVLRHDAASGASRALGYALLGTLQIVLLAAIFAVPLGVLAGLVLAEVREHPFARAARVAVDVLAGVPSIVIGIAVYVLVVVPMGGASALAGSMALALVMLPVIARTTDALARAVPDAFRESALTLGASRWRIAVWLVLRTAAPNMGAACMLAVAGALGETAPLLVTAHGGRAFTGAWREPTPSLEVRIFTQTMTGSDEAHSQAWATALVLGGLIAIVNVAARRVARRSL